MTEAGGRLRVFLSSPGDLEAERQAAARVLRTLDAELAAAGGLRLEVIRWEESWYSAERHFQEQLPRPSDCDLVVCLFWKRLGTEMPAAFARADGTPRSGSEWEFEEALEAARRSPEKRPDILVYRKTAPVTFAEATLALELAQKRALDGFWSRWFRSEEGQFLAAFKQFEGSGDFAALLEADLRGWLRDRRGAARWDLATQGSPYRGLAAFDARHGGVFFGRRHAVEQARARLIAAAGAGLPALFILGMSGAGKSSLLRAGLLPRLMQPGATPGIETWRSLTVTPAALGEDPFLGLARALAAVLPELAAGDFARPEALARLWSEGSALAPQPLLAALERAGGAGLLLALDQLEEVFAWPADVRQGFAALLRALLESGRVWLLVTLRSDFYPLLQADAALLALKSAGRGFDLAPPTAAEIREIVEGPAAAAGLTFERDPESGESLAERLERDAAGHGLPLLQFALARLYEERDAAAGLLCWASYRALGGLAGALEAHAEAALAALPEPWRQALPRLLFALATVKEEGGAEAPITAGTLPLEHLAPDSAERHLAEALVAARLLVAEGDGQGARLRVAHEALFTHWSRARDILAASRADLALAATLRRQALAWQAGGRSDDDLLRGARLLQAGELLRRLEARDADDTVAAFVAASDAARRRGERQRRRRLTVAFATLGLLLLVAVGFGLQALTQERRAEAARQEAEAQRAAAEHSLTVAAGAVESLVTAVMEELAVGAIISQERLRALLGIAEASLTELGDSPAAAAVLRAARARLLNALAKAYLAADDAGAAAARVAEALAILRDLTGREPGALPWRGLLAESLLQSSVVALAQGDLAGAQTALDEALPLLEALRRQDAGNAAWPDLLAHALNNLSALRIEQGDWPGAAAALEESLAIRHALAAADPGDGELRRKLAGSLRNLAQIQRMLGDPQGALASLGEAVAILRDLTARTPESGSWRRELADVLGLWGLVQSEHGDRAAALPALEEAVALLRDLVRRDPASSGLRRDLAEGLYRLAAIRTRLGDPRGAQAGYEEAVALLRTLTQVDPAIAEWWSLLAHSLNDLGLVTSALGDARGALAAQEEAVAIQHSLVEQDPGNVDRQRDLAVFLKRLGVLKWTEGDRSGALAAQEEVLAIRRALLAQDPDNAVWRRELAVALDDLGIIKNALGDQAGALAAYREELAAWRLLAAQAPDDAGWQVELAGCLVRVGDLSGGEAAAYYREALAILRALEAEGRLPAEQRPWIEAVERRLAE